MFGERKGSPIKRHRGADLPNLPGAAKLTKSGPLNRDGFVADAVVGAFAQDPPHELFRHIHQGVLLLNADFAQQTAGDVGIVG